MSYRTQVFLVLILCRLVISLIREHPIVRTDVGLIRGLRATDGCYAMYMGIPYAVVDEDNPFGSRIMLHVLSFLITFLFQNVISVDPLVDTNVGLIRGVWATDGNYSMFMGIPYAIVNEDNPFGDSIPFPRFNGTFDAYDDTAICPQIYQYNETILGTLDCLHLNIYVPPSASSENRLPVMVWVHGGAFSRGFSGRYIYGPRFLVQHDVIIATLNYRVDAYGFMCLDIPEVPGNQGLKDQFLALQWIRDNIEAFGGDVDKITLFGQSAGGHSVDLHLISNKEKIYNNVILQSGSAVATTVLFDPPKSAHLDIARYLGFQANDTYEALSFLAKSDTNLIIEATRDLNIIFKPCVEREFDGVESFISSQWINTEVPKVKDTPVLLGFTEHEMAHFHNHDNSDHFLNLDIVSRYIRQTFNFDDEEFTEMKAIVENFYCGDEGTNINMRKDIIAFDSDYTYLHPIHRTIDNYLNSDAGNIFLYMFSYLSVRNAIPDYAAHSDDLRYLFDMSRVTVPPTIQDERLRDQMTTMWTNFAKYSDPTPESSEFLPVKWLPLTNDTYRYLHIDTELSLRSRPLNQRMTFWNLFYKLNEQSQRGYVDIS